ncbi:Ribonuclease P protein subunit p40 [Frankliniella fusca]|uniref:Ribonuclease P protein subunit p40 n=1 Tax=Frankliniella fusca TaxID=407009 RepID=A0AAE1HJA4_9NEOP|nr:Ribonuclease P protein subunit p40 [Frankliniella fusca]
MLAPEVWAFDPPASCLKVVQGTLESYKEVENVVKSHPANHFVSVVLPDTPQVPQGILEALSSDNEYYKVSEIRAHELVEKEFIDAFVKRGQITALSINSQVDLNNCLSLTPDGHLFLSLTKESYQVLGLEGKAIVSKAKDHQRYIHITATP